MTLSDLDRQPECRDCCNPYGSACCDYCPKFAHDREPQLIERFATALMGGNPWCDKDEKS